MNYKDILNIIRRNKDLLEEKYGVISIALFGSYSRGEQTEDSDIDLLVELDYKNIGLNYMHLYYELENILNKKIDLVSIGAIKDKYLHEIKEDLIYT